MENSTTTYSNPSSLPRQKLPMSQKTQEWREACIDSALSMIGVYNNTRRSPRYKKQRNYDLLNGKIHNADLEYAVNPLGINTSGITFPATMQPYDCWNPVFQTLFGEEAKRPMNFLVRAINDDAITEKEEGKKQQVVQVLQEYLANSLQDPNTELDISAIDKIKHSYQDMRESIATQILTYLRKDLNLDMVFQKGWEDALVAGEEIYCVESLGKEPRVRRVNPLELHVILPHNSDLIDDAEVIVEDTLMNVSQIIDNFYDELTPGEIDSLEEGNSGIDSDFHNALDVVFIDGEIPTHASSDAYSSFDSKGNIRVRKVTWKSKKKVGELTYVDPTTGNQETTFVSEEYKRDKSDPNTKVKWFWVNQYWEGYKIGNNIYKSIKPKNLQFRRMDNISICKSGYVGTVYNCNNSQSVSLMDRLVPYIYLYLITWYNTELAMATNMGKIALIDVATVPDGWEIDKWLHYARHMKIGFVNSFNEGKKGQATGKLAGNMQSQNKALDLETGNYIQNHIKILEYLEQKLQRLSGISPQRMGDVSPSELVGNVENAIQTSSTITERWFQIHNYTKQRVLDCLIETAKDCWSQKTKKLQYVTDDLATVFFSVDGNEFVNSEYGVFVTNASKDQEALQILKQYMHAALQNDAIELSTVVDTLTSESVADIKNKLKKAEENKIQRQQQQAEAEQQTAQQQIQVTAELKQQELDLKKYEIDTEADTKIQVAQIATYNKVGPLDQDNDGIPDPIEIGTLALKEREASSKAYLEQYKLQQDKEKHSKEMEFKQKELDLKSKIEDKKIKAVEVQNKSQEKMQDKDIKLKEKEMKNKVQIERLKARNKPKPTKKK